MSSLAVVESLNDLALSWDSWDDKAAQLRQYKSEMQYIGDIPGLVALGVEARTVTKVRERLVPVGRKFRE